MILISPEQQARFDAALSAVLAKCVVDDRERVKEAIQDLAQGHGVEVAIEHMIEMAAWEPPPPPPPVVCDACGTSFPTFCPGQAYGCDSGLTSDRTGFGGAYGSKHDCCYYTVADPASFPGNDVCDACIDAMLADGRLVDGRHVNLATGEMVSIEDDQPVFAAYWEPDEDLRFTVERIAEMLDRAAEDEGWGPLVSDDMPLEGLCGTIGSPCSHAEFRRLMQPIIDAFRVREGAAARKEVADA